MDPGLRVVVLTGRDLVRHGVRGMLEDLPMRVHIVDALDPAHPADVMIVDATGTTDENAERLEIVTDDESAPVVLLTSRELADGFRAWDRPAFAVVTVSATDAEMVAAVAAALRLSARSRASRALASPHPAAYGLSERETSVLTGVAAGLSNEEIGRELFIAVNTVKTHIRTAYKKIGSDTRPRAILWALAHGLGPDGVGRFEDDDARWSGGDDPTGRVDGI